MYEDYYGDYHREYYDLDQVKDDLEAIIEFLDKSKYEEKLISYGSDVKSLKLRLNDMLDEFKRNIKIPETIYKPSTEWHDGWNAAIKVMEQNTKNGL